MSVHVPSDPAGSRLACGIHPAAEPSMPRDLQLTVSVIDTEAAIQPSSARSRALLFRFPDPPF
jgi:hypothetical protein